MYKSKTLLSILVFVISCKSGADDFYSYYTYEDLYRLPLIPPYQITNLAGFDERPYASYSWELRFVHGGDKNVYGFNEASFPGVIPSVRPTAVNVTNGIIYGYNRRGEFESQIGFVIVPREKIEKVFKNDEKGWKSFLEQRGIKIIKLFEGWQLFKQFKETNTLPWYNPDRDIYPEKVKL